MLNEWVKFLLACMAVLAVVVLGTSDIKIPGSGLTASLIEPTSTSTEPIPIDSTSASASVEPVPAESEPISTTEPVIIAPTGVSIFQDILQVFLPPLSIENPAPIPAVPKGLSQLKVSVLAQDTLESFERTLSETSISSPVSINVAVNYPDDLVYDGLSGSVGLTREPLLNMKWWGIAVYTTETENFAFECVSTASPLPTAVFNLGGGDYRTSLSLAETKADCEAFIANEYPLFAVLEAANFTFK